MNSTDLVTMLGNLSRSLTSLERLISGLGFVLGILLVISGFMKFKKAAEPNSHEKVFVPIAYIVLGSALIYSPSMLQSLSNTTFGAGNPLQYIQYSPYNIYNSIAILIQTAGLIWFVRGSMLLVHSTEGGKQEGPKGLAFVAAGICAVNFQATIGMVQYILNGLMHLSGFSTSI